MLMHFRGQAFNAFGQVLGHFRKPGVQFKQFEQLRGVLRRLCLAFAVGHGDGFAVQGIGIGLGFVPRSLTGLGQQDQGSGIRRLQAERQVEQDERINVELGHARDVKAYPDRHDQRLGAQESRRAEEPCKGLGAQGELVVAERWLQVSMGAVKAQMVDGSGGFGFVGRRGHDDLCVALGLTFTIAPAPFSF